jgi:hypothetical protein
VTMQSRNLPPCMRCVPESSMMPSIVKEPMDLQESHDTKQRDLPVHWLAMVIVNSTKMWKLYLRPWLPQALRRLPGVLRQLPHALRQLPGALRRLPGAVLLLPQELLQLLFLFRDIGHLLGPLVSSGKAACCSCCLPDTQRLMGMGLMRTLTHCRCGPTCQVYLLTPATVAKLRKL